MSDRKKPATSSRIAEAAREIARNDDRPWESISRPAGDCVPHWDSGRDRDDPESANETEALATLRRR